MVMIASVKSKCVSLFIYMNIDHSPELGRVAKLARFRRIRSGCISTTTQRFTKTLILKIKLTHIIFMQRPRIMIKTDPATRRYVAWHPVWPPLRRPPQVAPYSSDQPVAR